MLPGTEMNTYLPSHLSSLAELGEHGFFTEEKVKSVLNDISNGLRFLHKNGIIHGEITPHNILVDSNGKVKITGLDKKGDIKSRLGSMLAPEFAKMIAKKEESMVQSNEKSDIYQLGGLISTMLYGNPNHMKNQQPETTSRASRSESSKSSKKSKKSKSSSSDKSKKSKKSSKKSSKSSSEEHDDVVIELLPKEQSLSEQLDEAPKDPTPIAELEVEVPNFGNTQKVKMIKL